MGLYDANGNRLAKGAFPATPVTETDPRFTVTARVYRKTRYGSETGVEGTQHQLLYRPGQVIRQSDIDRDYPAATIATILPVSGTTAGTTVVTIKGTNLDGVSAVTFGGTAATNVQVLNSTTVTCVTPARAAGAVTVVLTDDAGPVSKANGYTYA